MLHEKCVLHQEKCVLHSAAFEADNEVGNRLW